MVNKDTTVLIRINSELKAKATEIAEKEGTDLSKLINAYLLDTVHRGKIPLSVVSKLGNKFAENQIITVPFIKAKLEECLKRYNLEKDVRRAILFGSYARNEQTENSDIDIRLEIDSKEVSGFDVGNFYYDLQVALHKDLDLVTAEDEKLGPKFLTNLKKDGICLYERER